jgi:hypothetical protein
MACLLMDIISTTVEPIVNVCPGVGTLAKETPQTTISLYRDWTTRPPHLLYFRCHLIPLSKQRCSKDLKNHKKQSTNRIR